MKRRLYGAAFAAVTLVGCASAAHHETQPQPVTFEQTIDSTVISRVGNAGMKHIVTLDQQPDSLVAVLTTDDKCGINVSINATAGKDVVISPLLAGAPDVISDPVSPLLYSNAVAHLDNGYADGFTANLSDRSSIDANLQQVASVMNNACRQLENG